MPSDRLRVLRAVWIAWLRFEYRALAVILPIVCLELAFVIVIMAHLPLYLGLLGVLPAFLGVAAWRFASQIGAADRVA
jgi:hypothetical protein